MLTENELNAVRFEFDPAPPHPTLMMHFCVAASATTPGAHSRS